MIIRNVNDIYVHNAYRIYNIFHSLQYIDISTNLQIDPKTHTHTHTHIYITNFSYNDHSYNIIYNHLIVCMMMCYPYIYSEIILFSIKHKFRI